MTNEELDRARGAEAARRCAVRGFLPMALEDVGREAACLAREGWGLPRPDLDEAREYVAMVERFKLKDLTGAFLAAIQRGRELERMK